MRRKRIPKAEEIKILLLSYWRFHRGCPIVATEFNYGESDVISYSERNHTFYETEVKISIADMRREQKKMKHRRVILNSSMWDLSPTYHLRARHFYFAVPEAIQEQALKVCEELFPYAGLLVVRDYEKFLVENETPNASVPIGEVKKPRSMEVRKVTPETIQWLAKGMSNTLCKVSYELMLLKREKQRR